MRIAPPPQRGIHKHRDFRIHRPRGRVSIPSLIVFEALTNFVNSRVWTEYFDPNPCNYQYQEIGAMRIPITATFPLGNQSLTRNFTNHEIVFHLTEELNRLNKHDETWAIDWIPFLQNSDNALSLLGDKRNPDGSIPTAGDVAKNPALGAETLYTDALDALREKVNEVEFNPEMMELIAKNIYEAHKKFLGMPLFNYPFSRVKAPADSDRRRAQREGRRPVDADGIRS
ncbi:uncharacterized protein BJX67DRAFT_368197 [Aspergillus lucknowensis]|uniref:Uncharacterized protein n=1 Tax=Aspergillus lucknowensis TaxID=176173 RepID=A0ABR4L816_9EURO